jgi:hypothetical protein
MVPVDPVDRPDLMDLHHDNWSRLPIVGDLCRRYYVFLKPMLSGSHLA